MTTQNIIQMGFWNFFGVLMVMAAIGLLAGFIIGRDSKPWRKTRYFVDGNNLRRWKLNQNYTEVTGLAVDFVWCSSSFSLKRLLTDCVEIDSLKAYQMFPQAFKK